MPSSPFAIGGTLTSVFCLDYYFAFREDPVRRARAEQALDLARTFVHRYLTMWPSDSDWSDRFDSTFLWEPNSGRDWCGAACANEVTWCLDTMAMTAVNTGDPVLVHALRGSLDRWPLLYKERYHDSLAGYEGDAQTEGYALYDDTVYGERGTRASWGWGPALPMLEPVGGSTVRVLAGMQTALAFAKNGVQAEVSEYHCAGPGDLRVTLACSPQGPHDVSLTFPFADLSTAPVWIQRGGERLDLSEGRGLRRPSHALWSLYLEGLNNGDTICVGSGAASSPALRAAPLLPPVEQGLPPRSPFRLLRFPGALAVERNWADITSWAGLAGGLNWAHGVPLALGLPSPAAVAEPVRFARPFAGPGVIFLAYSKGDGDRPSVALADGTFVRVDAQREALAWQAWPPIFSRRMLVAPAAIGARTAVGVNPGSRLVFAATALGGSPEVRRRYLALLSTRARQWQSMLAAERRMAGLAALGRAHRLDGIALLPYGPPVGRLAVLLGRSRVMEGVTRLTPDQLIQPGMLTPARFPVLLDIDHEEYVKTVRSEGDAAAALLRYVRDGGFLILATDGPFPLYYGRTPQGSPSDPLLPQMGLPIKGFEKPPAGERITLVATPGQRVLADVPARIAFPADDQRLRAVERDKLPAGATYTPIYAARGAAGADYGDAACLVEFPKGGRVLYVWFGLLRDPKAGPAVAEALLRHILAELPPAAVNRP